MDGFRLDDAEIDKTAAMARLAISPEERERFRVALSHMLQYFSVLAEQPVADLPATTHPLARENQLRADRLHPWETVDDLLHLAPELEDRFVSIPNVL